MNYHKCFDVMMMCLMSVWMNMFVIVMKNGLNKNEWIKRGKNTKVGRRKTNSVKTKDESESHIVRPISAHKENETQQKELRVFSCQR